MVGGGEKDPQAPLVSTLKWICHIKLKTPPANRGPKKTSPYQSNDACARD